MAMTAVAALVALEARAPAVALLVAAALLDAFDGWYARTFAQCSNLGKHLDPFADKVLVLVVYVWIGIDTGSALVWSLIAIVFAREAGMTVLRSYSLRRHGRFIPARPLGRLKMFLQCSTGLGVLISGHWFGHPVSASIVLGTLVLVVGVSYASAVAYVRHWVDATRHAPPDDARARVPVPAERAVSGG
jgi:phosphatidylglycerophosphate synthase